MVITVTSERLTPDLHRNLKDPEARSQKSLQTASCGQSMSDADTSVVVSSAQAGETSKSEKELRVGSVISCRTLLAVTEGLAQTEQIQRKAAARRFRWGVSPHNVASMWGVAPMLAGGGEFRPGPQTRTFFVVLFIPNLALPMFLRGASPHNVASVGGAAPPVVSGEEFRQHLAPTLPPFGEFQTPARWTSSPRSRRSSVDVAWRECSAVDVARRCCSAVDVARRCCSAVDVAWPCCSAVDVTRLCCSAVDVARRLRLAVDVVLDPLALPSGPLLPPLVSLLLLTPPTCLALILVPPTCLALVLASPQLPRPASRSPHRPLYVPSSSSGPIAGPDFLGRAKVWRVGSRAFERGEMLRVAGL
ncbi:hypothetical protein QTP86_007083, partial [Hemibagrus guttatus]